MTTTITRANKASEYNVGIRSTFESDNNTDDMFIRGGEIPEVDTPSFLIKQEPGKIFSQSVDLAVRKF